MFFFVKIEERFHMPIALSGPHGLFVFNNMEHGFTPKEGIESVRFVKKEWSVEQIKQIVKAIKFVISSIPDDNTYPTLTRPASE